MTITGKNPPTEVQVSNIQNPPMLHGIKLSILVIIGVLYATAMIAIKYKMDKT